MQLNQHKGAFCQWFQGEWGGEGYYLRSISYNVTMPAREILTESALKIVHTYSDGKTV